MVGAFTNIICKCTYHNVISHHFDPPIYIPGMWKQQIVYRFVGISAEPLTELANQVDKMLCKIRHVLSTITSWELLFGCSSTGGGGQYTLLYHMGILYISAYSISMFGKVH